jgi:DNA-binding LacI/PurR family transcriptional regulator
MPGPPMPSRGNLVVECARVIRLRISSGEWRQALPGERRLATTLQVGRDTIRLALQQLERDGVLSSAEPGVRRGILNAEPPQAIGRALKIGLLAHRRLEQLPQPMLLEIDRIRDALADKGGSLEVFAPSWYQQHNPAKRLQALVSEENCSAWMLLRSSAAVQSWFMHRNIPGLIRGYPHPGIEMPHLDVDWHATARHAAGQLWRMGHRRVVVLSPAQPLKGVEAAVRGVLELGEPGFEAAVLVEDGTTAGIGRVLERALRLQNPPTAVVATRPRQAATALTWLASHGIRVPQHISLITLAWEPFLNHLVPDISGYRVDPDAVAKLVVRRMERLVAGGPHPAGSTWITPEPVKGASVAKLSGSA